MKAWMQSLLRHLPSISLATDLTAESLHARSTREDSVQYDVDSILAINTSCSKVGG